MTTAAIKLNAFVKTVRKETHSGAKIKELANLGFALLLALDTPWSGSNESFFVNSIRNSEEHISDTTKKI